VAGLPQAAPGLRPGGALVGSQGFFQLPPQSLDLGQGALQLPLQRLDLPFEFLLSLRGATAAERLRPLYSAMFFPICPAPPLPKTAEPDGISPAAWVRHSISRAFSVVNKYPDSWWDGDLLTATPCELRTPSHNGVSGDSYSPDTWPDKPFYPGVIVTLVRSTSAVRG